MAFSARTLIVTSIMSALTAGGLVYLAIPHAALASAKPPQPEASGDNEPPLALPSPARVPSSDLTLLAIDKLRADVLAKLDDAKTSTPPGDPRVRREPALSAEAESERVIAGQQALDTVRSAITVGTWEAKDRDTLRTALGKVDDETCLAVQRELAEAINSRRVKVAVAGPPW